jgi:hypothetical protein
MAKKNYNPKSLKNLVQFNEETARPAQLKSARKRSENATALAIIDKNLDALLNLINTPMTDDEFEQAVAELPTPFLRIYGKDLSARLTARVVVEKLIDRIKGLPHQSADVNMTGDVNFNFKFGDQ